MKERLPKKMVEKHLSIDHWGIGGGYTLTLGDNGEHKLMPRGNLREVWQFMDGYELAMQHAESYTAVVAEPPGGESC